MANGKPINVGLNLLRILLTLGVVLDHFWIRENPEALTGIDRLIWHLRTLAVPAFMTMSFFFTAGRFWTCDGAWAKKRFVRLYEPFVFWSVAYYVFRTVLSRFNPEYATSLSDLLWQLLLGSSRTLAMQFWFHADLIILTALFLVAFKVVRLRQANLWLSFAALAVGFGVQYSPFNEWLFSGLRFEVKYPLGRIFCMLPYAGAGFLMAALKPRLDMLRTGWRIFISAAGLALAWVWVFAPPVAMPAEIVGYEGVNLSLIAWGVMAAFYFIPFEGFPAVFSRAVLLVSRYSMGVYCVHLALGWVFHDYVLRLEKVSFSFGELRSLSFPACLGVWALSYLFCWMFSKLPVRFVKRVIE